ncbi:glycosyltransferase family 2 protein [Spongisporangium articulatum]|uniref:Glycosyltransferase family 2 protein n=1 Tax=Spongisporangium articulatum TaxID=3362603 RepID=A0ABW8ANE6_9ACTN
MHTQDGLGRPQFDRVAAILVNWNSADDCLRCSKGILELYPDIKVVVVDNGSELDDLKRLESELPTQVELIARASNDGYGVGINAGLEHAHVLGAHWAWLTNPDSTVGAGSLEELLLLADGSVAVGPRQTTTSVDGRRKVYASAARLVGSRVVPVVCDGTCSAGYHDVDVLTGTGLLIGVGAALQAGLMNSQFFHYKEEFEFLERLRRLGKVRLACRAEVWHERGGSLAHGSPLASFYKIRNELLYLNLRGYRWYSPRLLRFTMLTLLGFALGRGAGFRVRVLALWAGMRKEGGRYSGSLPGARGEAR